jgi:uncharacterized protein Smg (DUF494 family)
MDQRIVEILMYVIGEIRSRRIRPDEVEAISDGLVAQGFTPREVATALSLFIERFQRRIQRREPSFAAQPQSHRVLHPVERLFLSSEAYGYLLQLHHLGILDAEDLEAILQRVLMMGSVRVGEEEMKLVVASYLVESDARGWAGPSQVPFARFSSESIH